MRHGGHVVKVAGLGEKAGGGEYGYLGEERGLNAEWDIVLDVLIAWIRFSIERCFEL